MMERYKVRLLPSAHRDIQKAKDWYKQHGGELPTKFVEEVRRSVEKIAANPFTYTVRYRDVSIANMQVFPFGIHYLVKPEVNNVIVIGIFHTSMSPERWERL